MFEDRPPKHETPELALRDLHGLTSSDLEAIVRRAVNYGEQVAPAKHIDRYYLAELGGIKYNFHYWIEGIHGPHYRLRDHEAEWAVEFRSTSRLPPDDEVYIVMPVVSVTARACFEFRFSGDADKFRRDMTVMKLFI